MAKRKLRVAFVTPEVAPYAKSGELADVAASLPKALAARGDGFVFEEFTPEALTECLSEALDLYAHPKTWRRVMNAGFRKDFSWGPSAGNYIKLYARSLRSKRGDDHVR